MYELTLLAKAWRILCAPKEYLTQETFNNAFARADLRSQLMLDALFNAADANSDKQLQFREAINALSVITRGTLSQKAELSFNLCDLNNDGRVMYQEALAVFEEMARVLTALGKDPITFGNPKFVADNLYRYQSVAKMGTWTALLRRVGITPPRVTKNNEVISSPSTRIKNAIFRVKDEKGLLSLTRSKWMNRARREPNVAECFGLFDLISEATTRRWQEKVSHKLTEGTLVVRVKSKLPLHRKHQYYCVCSNRFLVMYQHSPARDEYPAEVIALDYCAVDSRDAELGFRLLSAGNTWKFLAANKEEALQWALTLRSNVPHVTRFNSFAPRRYNISAKWYINGAGYFADIADAIENAKRRVFITDWFLSPQLPLKRGSDQIAAYWRLDALLKRKAEQGVLVCIQVWDETNLGFHSLRSEDAEKHFKKICPAIKFLRHPKWGPLQWTHHQKTAIVDDVAFLGGIDLTWGRYDNNDFSLVDPEGLLYPGRDFANQIVTHVECGGDQPLVEVDRNEVPRMPWHDIHCRVDGCAANDTVRNFIQRWNHGVKSACKKLPLLCPDPDPEAGDGTCTVQATRWSVGAANAEDSIYKAMLYLIETSEHYIFIENQYFISSNSEAELIPRNKIALAILDRLRKAMSRDERFHVFIILPLFPAGSLQDLATRYVLRWIYKTINLVETSILQVLRKEFPHIDTSEYVTFYNLRNFAFMHNRWVTQQIYVHSKLMIVDDKHVLIGSANINDRSLIGERDSEIAALISDTDEVKSIMAGQPTHAARFAVSLRRELWSLLLGYESPDDPVAKETIDQWRNIARNNSTIYRKVFPHIEDNLSRLDEWEPVSWSHPESVAEDRRRLAEVRGFIVEFVDILKDERMYPRLYEKEWLVDIDTFL